MKLEKTQPWFVEKRAEAFVYSLFAERPVAVRRQEKDVGVQFLLDVLKNDREMGYRLAVEVLTFTELPRKIDLEKEIASRFPPEVREKLLWPLAVFAVQVKVLAALYCWVLKPCVEKGKPNLCAPLEYIWKKLDHKAMDHILAEANEFWNSMKTIDLKDRVLPNSELATFKNVLEGLGAKFEAKLERAHGELATELKGCRVTFDPETEIMQRGTRASFDMGAYMKQIRQICKSFGFLN